MMPTPTQSQIQISLRAFLLSILPTTGVDGNPVEVISAQDNRVPEPQGSDFVVMTTSMRRRIETNIDDWADVEFTASIAGVAMTVTEVAFGTILVGATVFGTGVTANTAVVAQVSGSPGGDGVYTVSQSQSVPSATMASGAQTITQPTEISVQLDVHSQSLATAADMAQTISTLFRDEYAMSQFANQSPNYGVVPLYADDPAQVPFVNDQGQFETRYIVQAFIQVDQTITVPQQYADVVNVEVISVTATYPSGS